MDTHVSAQQGGEEENTITKNEPVSSSVGGKEHEPVGIDTRDLGIVDHGKENELAKEVKDAGVTVHPQASLEPTKLLDQEMSPTDQLDPYVESKSQQVLSDEKIAQGLRQGIEDSWRWLSELFTKIFKKNQQSKRG